MGQAEDLLNTNTPIGIFGNLGISSLTTGIADPLTQSAYNNRNRSYSGCDIRAVISDPFTGGIRIIGNLSTLSYSIHREKVPVRACGLTNPKGFTRGQRTIAGSLVFSIFDRYALYDIGKVRAKLDKGVGENSMSLLGDQFAPFDINCVFINEMGDISQLNIMNIELGDEGQVMSVNDIYTESTHSYVAQDIRVMWPNAGGPMSEKAPLLTDGGFFRFDAGSGSVVPLEARIH